MSSWRFYGADGALKDLCDGAAVGEETLYTVAASGAALTVNFAHGAVQDVTLTADCTFSLTAPPTGIAQEITLVLRQDGGGSRHVTWPGSVVWLGTGIPPILQTAAGSIDTVVLFTVDGGVTWFGVAQTSSSGLRSGTAFPGSPSDGDLFYRTDRRILYEYDSASLSWLSLNRTYYTMGMGDVLDNTTAAASFRRSAIFEDLYIEEWATSSFVAGTNDGSNYWTLALRKATPGNVYTNVGSFSTIADTVANFVEHVVSIGVVISAASFAALDINATKTGGPGALRCPSVLVCRSVG